MKVLILYAGIGGESDLWDDENNEITHVEIYSKIAKVIQDRKPNRKVVIADAKEYLKKYRNDYDFIWASPPCQSHSRMMKATRHDVADYFDPQLYQVIIFLEHFFKGYWVVENVKPYYKPLIKPSVELGRHLFWSNFKIDYFEPPSFKNFITQVTSKQTEKLKDWLGIHYDGNIYYNGNHCPGQVLRNAVHPKLGEHVFNCFLKYKQKTLFND